MNFKTTTVLIVLLAVVLGIVFFTGRNPKPADEQASDQPVSAEGRKLLDFTPAHVTRLSIINAKDEHTVLKRTDQKWALTSPVTADADKFPVDSLLSAIADIRTKGRPSSDPGSDSGLSSPRYRITVETTDNKTITLNIGAKTGLGDQMYAQVDGSDINLIDSSIEKTLKTAADDVRDKHLLTIKQPDVKQFSITQDKQTIAGELVNGKWKITQPTEMPGDSGQISTFLNTVIGTEATKFLKPDDVEAGFAGFDRPSATVWLSTNAPSTQPTTGPSAGGITLTIGAPDSLVKDNYFIQATGGPIAKIASSSLTALKHTPLDLRDRDIVSIPAGDVIQIKRVKETFATAPPTTQGSTLPSTMPELTKPIFTQQYVLVKRPPPPPAPLGPALPTTSASTMASATSQPATQPAKQDSPWRFAEKADSQTDDSKVQALLSKFSPLHADSFHQTPLDPPQQKWTVELSTASAKFTIVFQKSANATSAVGIYNDLTFDVPTTLLDALDVDFNPGAPGAAAPAAPATPAMPPPF